MTDSSRMPSEGDLIAGRYRIERALKRGGMGAVYVARHTETERLFAVKLMSLDLRGDAEAEARFEREARAESSIDHPGIVKVYDIGRHGAAPYLVMELLAGESLGEFLARGPMPPDDALLIMSKVLEAMQAAHSRGVVHRDLKPDNIYLAAGDGPVRPKILDFGISKLIDQDTHIKLTQTGVALGTPLYMSPEQVRGDSDVGRATDIYSLGVILFQMVTGHMPYTGANYAELVFKILNGEAPGVREYNPDLPEHLEAVIRCAMAPQLEQRYPDMDSFAADLQDLVRGTRPTIEARLSATPKRHDTQAPTPFATTAAREAMRAQAKGGLSPLWIGGGAALLVLGVVLGALLGRGGDGDGDGAQDGTDPAVTRAAAASAPAGATGAPGVPGAPGAATTPSARVVAPDENAKALAAPDAGTPDDEATRKTPGTAMPGVAAGADEGADDEPEAERASDRRVRRASTSERPRTQPSESGAPPPVLRVTRRDGQDGATSGTTTGTQSPAEAPAQPAHEIQMVDDDIIDPFQEH